jgi:hypothetical protein
MADILKTWPAFLDFNRLALAKFDCYFFSIGRGKPKQAIERIWFTHRGLIRGSFAIEEIAQNAGQFGPLKRIDGGESDWQFKADIWVVICPPPYQPLDEKIFHEGFRGWRYFDLEKHRTTLDAKIQL